MNEDVQMIKNFASWPYYPYLPVKRRVKGESWPELATLIHSMGRDACCVYLSSIDERQYDTCESIIYDSAEDMVQDGWVVD